MEASKRGRKRGGQSPLRRFSDLLRKSAALARHPLGRFLVQPLAALYGRLTLRRKGARRSSDIAELAHEFQGLFPSRRMYRIEEIRGDTAYMRIRVECPLRGTGDGEACRRMMQYDRTMASGLGGDFRVLSSQAVTGESTCAVAITARKGTLNTKTDSRDSTESP